MNYYDWMFGFAQIAFPALLLGPQLITAFKKPIRPDDLATFYYILAAYYLLLCITGAFALNLGDFFKNPSTAGFFEFVSYLASVFLSVTAILYIMRWTLQDQTTRELGLEGELMKKNASERKPSPKATPKHKGRKQQE